ncbi:hypothetical protein ACSU1N_01595 [Thermogladius sp. 4427co]|uniref:hypothetical protein n=1 Tax=Thermogladius sp. 4427co TaxID=3450718 RepID=UPI003F7A3C95
MVTETSYRATPYTIVLPEQYSGVPMPVKYVCSYCGTVLFEFRFVGQDYYGIPSPQEVYNLYGGICPNCHNELKLPGIKDIIIQPKVREPRLQYVLKPVIQPSGIQAQSSL